MFIEKNKEVIQPQVPLRLPCLSDSEMPFWKEADFVNFNRFIEMAIPPCGSMCGTAHSHISFQAHAHPIILPISPSYDLAHLAELWLDFDKNQKLAKDPLGWLDGQCVQGAGTYSPLDFTPRGYWSPNGLMTSDYSPDIRTRLTSDTI